MHIDINCDLGESFGDYVLGMDREVIPLVTSVNIACGMHAGDPCVMRRTVELATAAGVRMGAHPGYPDLQGFGRRNMSLLADEAAAYVTYQIGALQAFIRAAGGEMQHVKLHGALYNRAAGKRKTAEMVCRAIKAAAPEATVMCLSGSLMLEIAQTMGLATAAEVFADRAYNEDGTLVSRRLPGSVIHSPDQAVQQALRMVLRGRVRCMSGKEIPIRADSICVHGDNPSALMMIRQLRTAFEAAGVDVRALSAPRGR